MFKKNMQISFSEGTESLNFPSKVASMTEEYAESDIDIFNKPNSFYNQWKGT